MDTRQVRFSAIGMLLLAAQLSGCSGAPSGSGGQTSPSGAAAPFVPGNAPSVGRALLPQQPIGSLAQLYGNDGKQFIYTAQLYGNDSAVYRQQNNLHLRAIEVLTKGLSEPEGTKATINGWWYVANGGDSNILIYRSTKKGPEGPVGSLDDPGQRPVNVDLDRSRRLVVVSNAGSSSSLAGSVSVYLDRAVEPSRILTYGKSTTILEGVGVALDKHGNCYWSFNDRASNNGSIVEFAKCSGKGKVVVPTIAVAGGITFDQHDDLYYVDRTNGVYKCKHASNCKVLANGFVSPLNINFDLKHKHLWVADTGGYIDAIDPNTGKLLYRVQAEGGPSDPPFGIAPEPGG